MANPEISSQLAVILHADVADSTVLVQKNEHLAHEGMQGTFRRFSKCIEDYQGNVLELRGDALLAAFDRPSDAVTAAIAFQAEQSNLNLQQDSELQVKLRVGIAMGEVIIADATVTGAGVVLAQRVEQLATHGGVCVTSAIHEALSKRLPFHLNSLGTQSLKGFEAPVEVFRVDLPLGTSIPPPPEPPNISWSERLFKSKKRVTGIALVVVSGMLVILFQATGLPKKSEPEKSATNALAEPAIVVLPFDNMSDDPAQEYFADGMTEDLITDLSKVSGMFVVARNSAFTYKNKAVKVQDVARDLGVGYVLEGSVRKSDDLLRINAQLIDAKTGGHIWAERYDGKLDDVFTLQDDITRHIVDALAVSLTPAEEARWEQKFTQNMAAYDAYLKGWNLGSYESPEGFQLKVDHFKKATELDPTYGHAFASLADIYTYIYEEELTNAVGLSEDFVWNQAIYYLSKSLEYPTAFTYRVQAKLLSEDDLWTEALTAARLAIKLEPNNWYGYVTLCDLLIKMGQPVEAKVQLDRAMALNPLGNYTWLLASTHYHQEHYEDAVAGLLRHFNTTGDDDEWLYLLLAASYGQLNQTQKAEEAIDHFNKLRRSNKQFEPYRANDINEWTFQDDASRQRLREGLIKAGMPA